MYSIHRLSHLQYKSLRVTQKEFSFSDRPEVSNKYRKLFFFLLREGIIKTFRKIQSKRNKDLKFPYFLTCLEIDVNGKKYYNLSTQTTQKEKDFVIENVFFLNDNFDIKQDFFTLNNAVFNQFNNTNTVTYKDYIHLDEIEQTAIDTTTKKGVFLYGLGDYARVFIAPHLKRQNKLYCVDYKAPLAKHYKNNYGFEQFALVPQETYNTVAKVSNPLAIIATYHSDHTNIALDLYNHNPNTQIFIEKPPIVTLNDLKKLITLYNKGAKIDIGYNRRYIPVNQKIREQIRGKQVMINIVVKEILINNNHWYFWENQGTRITGNLTHWLDLATFWIDEKPTEINVISADTTDETIAVSVLYSNGSLLNISVSDKGNALRGVQEKIEIRTKEESFYIDDYLKYSHTKSTGKINHKRFIKRLKGHENMYKHVIKWHEKKEPARYTVKDLVYSSLLTHYTAKMFKENIRTFNIMEEIEHYSKLIE